MRVFKPTYTKPLPEGAKIFICKRGKHKGKKFVKFKDAKGHTTEARLAKDGNKILLETAHWHISFEDNLGICRELKAFTNEQASKKLADRIVELLCCQANNQKPGIDLQKCLEQMTSSIRTELINFQLLDVKLTAAGKPLTELIEEFERFLSSKELSAKYIQETVRMLKRVFDGCNFDYWSDISATKVSDYLKGLRDGGRRISYCWSNALLHTVRHFCRWMVKCGYASESPLQHLEPLNEELDRRHNRRALTVDELRRLLETTVSGPVRFGLNGYERYLLYWFDAETGLRANEIRTLTVGAFDFDNLTVSVEAGYSKHRHKDIQPLRPELAAELKAFFMGKMYNVKAFAGTTGKLTKDTAKMIRADLAEAKIPYKDDSGRVADFHALRHTFITNLKHTRGRVAQSLARHRSSAMTDRYTHIELYDERAALNNLPDLSLPSQEKQEAVKTGTDDKILLESCFSGELKRTTADSSGLTNLDTTKQTPLCDEKGGAVLNPVPSALS